MMIANLSRFLAAIKSLTIDNREQIRAILDAGSGQCNECIELLQLFPNATLTILDIDQEVLECIPAINTEVSRVSVIVGSIHKIEELAPGSYDMVIVRNPDIDRNRVIWELGFHAITRVLESNGLLIITVYSLHEMEDIEGILYSTNLDLMPVQVVTPVALLGNDRYILVSRLTQ
jgi:16S rRNA G1207 methylase RsmC